MSLTAENFVILRSALAALDASASSTVSGADRPHPEDIFAPEQHVGALDPNTTIVLGARGAGKSFWAGVLAHEDTRATAADAYPHIGLQRIDVALGYTGQEGDESISRATLDARVPPGTEAAQAVLFWRCVLLRAVRRATSPDEPPQRIAMMMTDYADPEDWEEAMSQADMVLRGRNRSVVVLFDALDSLAIDWARLRDLTDSLLQVAWGVRGYKSIRTKLFLRPDQIQDLGLRFIELPKLISGATTLGWSPTNLYGMLFSRLATSPRPDAQAAFRQVLESCALPAPPDLPKELRRWRLSYSRSSQMKLFERLAGLYMGRSNKKGRTYDWPISHLADGHGVVTPRSFLVLMQSAATFQPTTDNQALTAEGIRNGLREASKVRLEQLATEYKWIARVLVPLARLQVPCLESLIISRWQETETVSAVLRGAQERQFLPPIDGDREDADHKLIVRLLRMGVLSRRNDGRYDMPDLFRVAARLLRKGGVTPI
ncbi:MAG: hypothetical protein P4L71_13795 [Acetobacteraceae bacterium]|nr:hypothetical protein [Acetobacteraceae bacterium]MDR3737534.1 hypothetical protein [Terracidiphilus sp.]